MKNWNRNEASCNPEEWKVRLWKTKKRRSNNFEDIKSAPFSFSFSFLSCFFFSHEIRSATEGGNKKEHHTQRKTRWHKRTNRSMRRGRDVSRKFPIRLETSRGREKRPEDREFSLERNRETFEVSRGERNTVLMCLGWGEQEESIP